MKTLEGPAWSAEGLEPAGGRYPLSVERHVMRMADLLVPGVTTVTPHARYYALHGLIAIEVAPGSGRGTDTGSSPPASRGSGRGGVLVAFA